MAESEKLLGHLLTLLQGNPIQLADTFFHFLRTHTQALSTNDQAQQIQQIAVKHVQLAQSKAQATPKPAAESKEQSPVKATSAAAPAPLQPAADKDDPTKLLPSKSNGSSTEDYTWTQTLQLVEATLPLPANVSKKQIRIDIDVNHLKVQLASDVIIDAPLHAKIDSDDATWTIETNNSNQRVITLYLPKANKMEWWSRLVVGEPEINVQKIQPENSSISDLEPDVAQTVNKLMHEQQMKQRGLSTVPGKDEKENALKRFMQMHPEMDFSQAKISM